MALHLVENGLLTNLIDGNDIYLGLSISTPPTIYACKLLLLSLFLFKVLYKHFARKSFVISLNDLSQGIKGFYLQHVIVLKQETEPKSQEIIIQTIMDIAIFNRKKWFVLMDNTITIF